MIPTASLAPWNLGISRLLETVSRKILWSPRENNSIRTSTNRNRNNKNPKSTTCKRKTKTTGETEKQPLLLKLKQQTTF